MKHSGTPATKFLAQHGVAYTEHFYEYVEHGGTSVSSSALGVPEHEVVKTLVMEDEKGKPLLVLMHGNRKVSTKNLARQIGAKSVEPCTPEAAQRAGGSGWSAPRAGGRSPSYARPGTWRGAARSRDCLRPSTPGRPILRVGGATSRPRPLRSRPHSRAALPACSVPSLKPSCFTPRPRVATICHGKSGAERDRDDEHVGPQRLTCDAPGWPRRCPSARAAASSMGVARSGEGSP